MRATHGHREPSSTRMDDAGLGGRSRALVDEDGRCGAGREIASPRRRGWYMWSWREIACGRLLANAQTGHVVWPGQRAPSGLAVW